MPILRMGKLKHREVDNKKQGELGLEPRQSIPLCSPPFQHRIEPTDGLVCERGCLAHVPGILSFNLCSILEARILI